ncbi:DUF6458 family protein [Naumannella cuiyingiana]|uniref:Pilus assembly protein TadC n=1 Tax=Naumannella cuiyingiana TaxID=1347891 RepID=A0A7Z0D7G6_9ACTN|nr:DUF6458 family protein [Naumannella cuiyingiana]NYI70301.1 pilus assembly protein TadC [Naumannella cuiyingiana]
MGLIGIGIVLLVAGLILAFAWDGNIPGMDDDTLGYILLGAGILSIILGLIMTAMRRRSSVTETYVERRPRDQA